MFSHHLGRALAIASALLLSACKSFSPDGGMSAVAEVAGGGLNKNVVRISSAADASLARGEVSRLLRAPLGPDAAVQIALLNNAGLQAAYNRLGVAEAVMVQASRPPLPSFGFDWVKTSIELDVERQIVASILSLATWPARSKLAGIRFEQAELRAAEETLRLAAETRRAYIRAVAARQILTALNAAKASAASSASLSESLTQTGAVSKLDHAKRQVFATEMEAQVTAARQQAAASEERLTRLLGLWGTDLAGLLPNALPPLPGHARSLGRGRAAGDGAKGRSRRGAARSRGARPFLRAHAQDALHQCARRRRHLQDAEGQRRAFGRRRRLQHCLRGAALRFRQSARARSRAALSRSGQRARARRRSMPARRRARRSAPTKRATRSPPNMSTRCCRSETRSRRRPSCNSTPCRSTPSRCSKRRAPRRTRKWQASRRGGISGLPRPISASPCSAAEA